MFFLGFRNALFVGFAIPMSMFMSFMVLSFMGYTMNTMVLFGLVMGLGMLVDNGIVVVENVYRLMEKEGMSRVMAAKAGIGEIAFPIIVSTATTIAAFVPLGAWRVAHGPSGQHELRNLGTRPVERGQRSPHEERDDGPSRRVVTLDLALGHGCCRGPSVVAQPRGRDRRRSVQGGAGRGGEVATGIRNVGRARSRAALRGRLVAACLRRGRVWEQARDRPRGPRASPRYALPAHEPASAPHERYVRSAGVYRRRSM